MCSSLVSIVGYIMIITLNYNCFEEHWQSLVSKQMTHNICFILLAVDKENNNDPLKIWGLYLFVLAFPGECVNQLGSEVKSIPERSAGWFKTLDVWHRLMLCDINLFFLLIWSLELIKPYHKLLHNCHVSSWRPHHPDFEIFDGSRLTQPLIYRWHNTEHCQIGWSILLFIFISTQSQPGGCRTIGVRKYLLTRAPRDTE